jgi:formiminoglutamase
MRRQKYQESLVIMAEDLKWPRASSLISNEPSPIGLIDIPAHKTSISPTNAHLTPTAIREALKKYSTFSYSTGTDLAAISIQDLGQIQNPDQNERTTIETIQSQNKDLLIALGGDNSITFAAALGVFGADLSNSTLITLDAHHDLRDGISNGSPVRRLIEAGLNPKNIIQIGINDFSNSNEYAQLAKDLGIKVISRTSLAQMGIEQACKLALANAKGPILVDVDVDVCDLSVAPGCPAAAPGGISAFELRQAVRTLLANPKVRGMDITEIDASRDTEDQRTIRLGALVVLEAVTGYLNRGVLDPSKI